MNMTKEKEGEMKEVLMVRRGRESAGFIIDRDGKLAYHGDDRVVRAAVERLNKQKGIYVLGPSPRTDERRGVFADKLHLRPLTVRNYRSLEASLPRGYYVKLVKVFDRGAR
jgi:peroxiredoxin